MDDSDLTPSERELVKHCVAGTLCDLSNRAPEQRRVSARVIYELCVGSQWSVHAKGVRLGGARLDEPLSFEYAALRAPLTLASCDIAGVTLTYAIAAGVDLLSCVIREQLDADAARLGHFSLRGSTVPALRLAGATIEGHLDLIDAKLTGADADGFSLTADALRVGDAFMRGDLRTAGSVRLVGATVEGDLDFSNASLLGTDVDGDSLAADRVHVGGDVALRDGFLAVGTVRLLGAAIDGRLVIQGIVGINALRLADARCAVLADDRKSWPQSGRLSLRGFQLGALAGGDTGFKERLDWVGRQWHGDWSTDPYEQLAAFYSRAGDETAARRMRIAKNNDELAHLKRTEGIHSLWYRLWRRPYGWLVGYGYRRWPAGLLLVVAIVAAGGLFRWAEANAVMVPHEPTVDDADSLPPCGEAYPCFNAWVYGADVVLPIIDFGQDDTWRPVEGWVVVRWFFIAIGWTLASVFVVAFTALVQRR